MLYKEGNYIRMIWNILPHKTGYISLTSCSQQFNAGKDFQLSMKHINMKRNILQQFVVVNEGSKIHALLENY